MNVDSARSAPAQQRPAALGQGAEFLSPPQTPEAGPHAGGRVVWMVDPDGICIELLEAANWLDGTPRGEA